MRDIIVVEIKNPEKYQPFGKRYGILVNSMECTAGIQWKGLRSCLETRVAHEDYVVISPYLWEIFNGEIFVKRICGWVPTGLVVG